MNRFRQSIRIPGIRGPGRDRGSMLLVVVFVAVSIAGLATILSGRVVAETGHQRALERETRAFNGAYAQLQMAMNVVNTSPYTSQNQNVVLREAVGGLNGGTIAGSAQAETLPAEVLALYGGNPPTPVTVAKGDAPVGTSLATPGGENSGYTTKRETAGGTKELLSWLDDPSDPLYGFVRGTNVRVYRGRDYIKRLQRLRAETVTDVDPEGVSGSYFVLEAAGRAGDEVRLVSALVRENEPFSSFVFFQNRATLGVSGSPRGLIHSNESLAFYFPNGNYVDSVSAVNGFDYLAGATTENTTLRDANPEATPIQLEAVDFAALQTQADLYSGDPGLDAEVKFKRDGTVQITPHTPPRYEQVEKTYTYMQYMGTRDVTVTETKKVQVGEQEVAYTEQVLDHYDTETYTEIERVQTGTTTVTWTEREQVKVGSHTETRYRQETVQTGTQEVVKTRTEPVYEEQTVTKTRQVKVWQPYDSGDAGGGTAVGGGANGELGEWVWVEETYQATELVQVGTNTIEYTVTEPVYGTIQVPYDVVVDDFEWRDVAHSREDPVYEDQVVTKTRQVPVYVTVDKTRMEPVYEFQDVQVVKQEDVYEPVTVSYWEWEYQSPVFFSRQDFTLGQDKSGVAYVDGRVTRLSGDLNGRLTIVSGDSVRVTGDIRYVDDGGETAMLNGNRYDKPYERNVDYAGHSVLGVIARGDILLTRDLPDKAEVNATLMAIDGRVGIDGFWADATGELAKDSWDARSQLLSETDRNREYAYDKYFKFRPRTFVKSSLRRIGGMISNNRILETFVVAGDDGHAKVDAGFKRGRSMFDINLLFNPPPNFVEVPRPVITAVMPVFLVLNEDV